MHQHPRAPPRASSPASSAQTNPTRTNNPRDGGAAVHSRTGSTASGHSRRDSAGQPLAMDPGSNRPPYETVKKLDQILQNLYLKAAALVLDSRMKLNYTGTHPGSTKISKWFQIETRDFDDFREELRTWKNCGSFDNNPPSMVIEVYLDTSELAPSQSLVIVDEHGKRWDVVEALASSGSSSGGSATGGARRPTEVILERWRFDLRLTPYDNEDFGPILPTVYKKAIVFFRNLFTETRIIPCWHFAQHAQQKEPHAALRPRCRITTNEPQFKGADRLRHPLYNSSQPVIEEYVFGDLGIPIGRFYASIAYRKDLNFRVDDSETLLSSRFMGADESLFKPSLPQSLGRRDDRFTGSQGHDRRPAVHTQAYGSLSTFHGPGPLGTSPLSALNAMPVPGSDTSSPPASVPANRETEPPHSLPINSGFGGAMRPPLRTSTDNPHRRPSISFQAGKHPFKAGSLSASPVPRTHEGEPPASPQSLSRVAGLSALTQPRNRSSLTAGMPASLRGPAPPAQTHTPGPAGPDAMSSSPRPQSTSRYSSSFTHRRGRLSFSGPNRPLDDDQLSSGRQSVSSSVIQPGSGLLAEVGSGAGGGASSGSLQTDDDNISEFLKALESKKNLRSFEASGKGESSATNKTVAQLSRFHQMKEANNQLTESMSLSSSMQLQRSSSSSSRQLPGAMGQPGPAGVASLSVSSSPGKPLSPHTPHTPAVPSRLSENEVIHYPRGRDGNQRVQEEEEEEDDEEEDAKNAGRQGGARTLAGLSRVSSPRQMSREDTITQETVAAAIDIPLSPRVAGGAAAAHARRSSSAAQESRTISTDDDDTDLPFAHRSISLGADRGSPDLSRLRGVRAAEDDDHAAGGGAPTTARGVRTGTSVRTSGAEIMTQGGSSGENPGSMMMSPRLSSPFGRQRYMGMAAHAASVSASASASPGSSAIPRTHATTSQSRRGSFAGGLAAGGGANRHSRLETDDDEPLVFEMDTHSRKSLEDNRGGGNVRGTRRGW